MVSTENRLGLILGLAPSMNFGTVLHSLHPEISIACVHSFVWNEVPHGFQWVQCLKNGFPRVIWTFYYTLPHQQHAFQRWSANMNNNVLREIQTKQRIKLLLKTSMFSFICYVTYVLVEEFEGIEWKDKCRNLSKEMCVCAKKR